MDMCSPSSLLLLVECGSAEPVTYIGREGGRKEGGGRGGGGWRGLGKQRKENRVEEGRERENCMNLLPYECPLSP